MQSENDNLGRQLKQNFEKKEAELQFKISEEKERIQSVRFLPVS